MACNFSIPHYREILESALENGYTFVGYDDVGFLSNSQKACILRHDVDYLPEHAPAFAHVEGELGIKATYFFQVCAKPYNLREAGNYQVVQGLHKLGHTIGLHFDPTWKPHAKLEELASLCRQDKAVFEAITGIKPCEIVAFHNPHRFAEMVLNKEVLGMRHTYEKVYFSDIKYLSDSQGWYEGCMCLVFTSRRYPVIQLLTHPYIWPDEPSSGFIEDMAHLVQARTDELTDHLITYHPVCKRNETQFRARIAQVQEEKRRRWV